MFQMGTPGNNQSEVAWLMQQIALEYESGRAALHALASGIAQHQIITAKMERIQEAHERLSHILGDDKATEMVSSILAGDEPPSQTGK
jgi:hypothetical protein